MAKRTINYSGMKAVSYARVSKVGERGDDLTSPENQHYANRQWAERNGVTIVEEITDLDESGRKFEKRKVGEIMARIEARELQLVLLWKWSRWGRNLMQSRIYIAQTEKSGGHVQSSTETFDTATAMGRYSRDHFLSMAEFQSDQIGEQWQETQDRRRRMGLPHTSAPRVGYTYVKGEGYQIDETWAPVIRDLYRRANLGEGLAALARELNQKGYVTLTGKSWDVTSLGRMLDTGFAAGLIRERSNPPSAYENNARTLASFDVWREGAHKAIIDMDTWEAYRSRRLLKSRGPRGPRERVSPLSGLLVCRECGATMSTLRNEERNKYSWYCHRRSNLLTTTGVEIHPAVSLSERRVKARLAAWLEAQAQGGDDLTDRLAHASNKADKIPTQIEHLAARLQQLKTESLNLKRMKMKGEVDQEEFDILKADLDEQMASTRMAHDKAQSGAPSYVERPDRAVFESVMAAMDQATPERGAEALSLVIAGVVVSAGDWKDDDKVLVVGWDR